MDKSKHNMAESKRCRTDSAPTVCQVEGREDRLDKRDNPDLVSDKGSIRFTVSEEKGPGKMLRKWRKRGRGWKERKENQRARQRTESAIFLASVKKNLNKVMDQAEKQSLTRKLN
jgi:hypothetical protein